jgi:arylformamidase
MRTLLLPLILALPCPAAEPKAARDLPYTDAKTVRQTLDIFAPAAEGKDRPIVLFIHGGGWKAGDKKGVQKKPQIFTERGYVFVSTNYRFVPNATVKEMTGDIAAAIRYVHDHAKEYGGDPNAITVMGHSAGAHLAALVCTDDSYLKAQKLPMTILKGCVPIDVSVYDIPLRLKDGGSVPTATFEEIFGKDEASQKAYSPAHHVAKGKGIPPFLILHVADRADTKAQSHAFANKLKEAGVPAEVVAAEGKTHGTINSDLGTDGDVPTKSLWQFLEKARK